MQRKPIVIGICRERDSKYVVYVNISLFCYMHFNNILKSTILKGIYSIILLFWVLLIALVYTMCIK